MVELYQIWSSSSGDMKTILSICNIHNMQIIL